MFQVHGVDANGVVVIRRQLKRRYVLAFFQKLAPCLIGVEACAWSHFWARELKALGHNPRFESYNSEHQADIEIRRRKYLNNMVEQDHRAIKRVARPMLGFKSFRSAAATLAGVELMQMIRKGQLRTTGKLRPAKQFCALAV